MASICNGCATTAQGSEGRGQADKKRQEIYDMLHYYLNIGVVPVINENDVIDLNCFGGNDFLGARIASLLNVESLLILSTMAGSSSGVGGGEAKLQAVAMLKKEGIAASILDGKTKNILLEALL